jgi:hypothetical protein
MEESSPNLPVERRQSNLVVNLAGSGYIRLVSIVLAMGAAFLAFDAFLQVRKAAVAGGMNPHAFCRSLFFVLSLAIMAFLLWSYSGAILDFPETRAAGARRLERTHTNLWKGVAILLSAHLLYAAFYIAILMRL